MPKAAIIISTHDRPHLLPRAINSARASGSEVEVLVVDNASSDETSKICQSISGITYVRVERNQSSAGARNIGLVASHAEYVSFLDDRDQRVANSIDQQVEALDRNPEAGLIYGQALTEGSRGKQTPSYPYECPRGDVVWDLLSRNFIPRGSAVFRRSCLSRVGLLDDAISGIEDWDLWVRISEMYPIEAVTTPVIICHRPGLRTSLEGHAASFDLIELARRQFQTQWLNLPRVASAPPSSKRAAWRSFSNNASANLCEIAFGSLSKFELRHLGKGALTALRLHPTAWLGTLRQWAKTATQETLRAPALSRDDLRIKPRLPARKTAVSQGDFH